ncbi:MAG: TolC family protein [Bacteroidales bacterium]
MKKSVFSITFCLLIFTSNIFSQEKFESYIEVKDLSKVLPPLDNLIDSAIYNSSEIKRESNRAEFFRREAKTKKREWTKHFGLVSEVNYGNWQHLDWNELNSYDFVLSQSRRTNWIIGAYLRFPFFALLDRKNSIEKEKKMQNVILAQEDVARKRVIDEVTKLYYELLQNQRKLKISNEFQQFTLVQMKMAENRFYQGEISVSEYTRLKEIQIRGKLQFENIFSSFRTSYHLLENKVGFKFCLTNMIGK